MLIISSNCCTTSKLLEFTSGTILRACPDINGKTAKRTSSSTFLVKDGDKAGENPVVVWVRYFTFDQYSDTRVVPQSQYCQYIIWFTRCSECHSAEYPIEFSSEDEVEVDDAAVDKETADFEKVEEPRHSPCEELEKPYSPTDSIEKIESFDGRNGIDGEPLEDGEIKENGGKIMENGIGVHGEVSEVFPVTLRIFFWLYFNDFKILYFLDWRISRSLTFLSHLSNSKSMILLNTETKKPKILVLCDGITALCVCQFQLQVSHWALSSGDFIN